MNNKGATFPGLFKFSRFRFGSIFKTKFQYETYLNSFCINIWVLVQYGSMNVECSSALLKREA